MKFSGSKIHLVDFEKKNIHLFKAQELHFIVHGRSHRGSFKLTMIEIAITRRADFITK